MKKLLNLWKKIPRVIQYFLAGAALSVVRTKIPGIIPEDLTPDKLMGGAAGLAFLHHLEDKQNKSIP